MIIDNCEQYSPEWWKLRLGIPTASRFGSIITDVAYKPSAGRFSLIADLIMEARLGKPSDFNEGQDTDVYGFDTEGTPWMKRGSEVEDEARTWYQLIEGEKVHRVGFCLRDKKDAGCSPDGLIGEPDAWRRGLEIKCRSAKYHMRMLLGYDEIAKTSQVQGSMWVTGLDEWDVLAYCPGLPARLDRHYRDVSFMSAMDRAFGLYLSARADAEEVLARITEDVVRTDNRADIWSKAVQKKPTRPGALSVDDLDTFRKACERARHLELIDVADYLAIVDDIASEEWASVRQMVQYVTRLLETSMEVTA